MIRIFRLIFLKKSVSNLFEVIDMEKISSECTQIDCSERATVIKWRGDEAIPYCAVHGAVWDRINRTL